MIMINQSRASSVAQPTTVSGVISAGGCAKNIVTTGGGAGGEYFGILQKAQSSAVCACSGITDTGVTPRIALPVPCINMNAPPFTQQVLSTAYVAPCTNPGKRNYFPPKIYDGPGCTYNRLTMPSG